MHRIVIAILVGIITTLLCLLVGSILLGIDTSPTALIGAFLTRFSGLLGLISGLYYIFSGSTSMHPRA